MDAMFSRTGEKAGSGEPVDDSGDEKGHEERLVNRWEGIEYATEGA
jgi:hypothetical protein